MPNDVIFVTTDLGTTEFKVEHYDEDFCVLSNPYGVTTVVSDKKVLADSVDLDNMDEMQSYDYQSDDLYVINSPLSIHVTYVDGVPYEDNLEVSFSDVREVMEESVMEA